MSVRTEPKDLSQQLQQTLTIPQEVMMQAANPAQVGAPVVAAQEGAVAPADDSIPDAARRQPHGGARCCTDCGPRHCRIYRHLRGDSAELLRGL